MLQRVHCTTQSVGLDDAQARKAARARRAAELEKRRHQRLDRSRRPKVWCCWLAVQVILRLADVRSALAGRSPADERLAQQKLQLTCALVWAG